MLDALRHRLMDPELLRGVRGRVHRRVEPAAGRGRRRPAATKRSELAEVRRQIDGMIRAIEEGLYEPSMKERMQRAGAAARGAGGRAGDGAPSRSRGCTRPGGDLPAEGGGAAARRWRTRTGSRRARRSGR